MRPVKIHHAVEQLPGFHLRKWIGEAVPEC
jgi:hypothetical protein